MAQKPLPGPVGTSCLTCKQRHKKCDQRRPTCERCEMGDFECLGYNHNEKARASTARSVTTQKLRSILPAPKNSSSSSHSTSRESGYEKDSLESSLLSLERQPPTTSSALGLSSSPLHGARVKLGHLSNDDNTSALTNPPKRRVEDYLYLFAPQSSPKSTDSPMSILRKIVNLQTQLPHSLLDPLKTFLNSQWFSEYILARADKVTDYWGFKLTNHKKIRSKEDAALRLQTTNFTRWIILVSMGVVESVLTGDVSQISLHNFWLGYMEGSVKRELMRDLTPRETQARRTDWVLVSLLKAMMTHSSNIYQVLQSITPTFLQVVFADPTLWPDNSNVTHVPLSNILALETHQLAFFALLDCTCALAFGLPQQVEYNTTIYPQTSNSLWHQWTHSIPGDFQLILAAINACRDKSPVVRDWEDIEQWLLTWQPRLGEHTFTESWMTVAWYAVQESWRLALLVYLYLAVCDTPSDDPRIQSYIKQILQVVRAVKKRGSEGNISFFVHYLVVGICARSETHRKVVRDKLSAHSETKLWLLRESDFVPVLDHLWHGAAVDGRPIKWSDYMRSREAILPIVP